MLGPTSKSCWAKTKVGQDKDHVGVHIGQHQGHVGTDIKVMLAKTKVNMALGSHLQDKDHVGVHIGQHQGHIGADIKVKLGGPC